jgi:hypothetical protein
MQIYLSIGQHCQKEVDKESLLQTKNIISDFILLYDDTFSLTFEAYIFGTTDMILFFEKLLYHAFMMFWEIQVF